VGDFFGAARHSRQTLAYAFIHAQGVAENRIDYAKRYTGSDLTINLGWPDGSGFTQCSHDY
jgi:hypothetical protein